MTESSPEKFRKLSLPQKIQAQILKNQIIDLEDNFLQFLFAAHLVPVAIYWFLK